MTATLTSFQKWGIAKLAEIGYEATPFGGHIMIGDGCVSSRAAIDHIVAVHHAGEAQDFNYGPAPDWLKPYVEESPIEAYLNASKGG